MKKVSPKFIYGHDNDTKDRKNCLYVTDYFIMFPSLISSISLLTESFSANCEAIRRHSLLAHLDRCSIYNRFWYLTDLTIYLSYNTLMVVFYAMTDWMGEAWRRVLEQKY